jgi:hypothetical protein
MPKLLFTLLVLSTLLTIPSYAFSHEKVDQRKGNHYFVELNPINSSNVEAEV